MPSIQFGAYDPVEIKSLPDNSDQNILSVEWLDEQRNPISTKIINGVEFSNIMYGGKVKMKVKLQNYSDNRKFFISISTNNKDCRDYKLPIPMFLVKNNEVLSDVFYLPITLYRDEIEEYDYNNHDTKIATPQEFYVTVLVKTSLKSKPNHILKPYTYFRNYEALVGLFKIDNSGKKHFTDNYENQFIGSYFAIKAIVDSFIATITDIQNISDETKIDEQVKIYAKALWDTAVNSVQSGNFDDCPLYWARNKMQIYLKRHPIFKEDINIEKSLPKANAVFRRFIKLFEELSSNYTGIDFSGAKGKKKALITGFDPFQLNPDFTFNTRMGSDSISTFNPSGIVVLSLHNNKEFLSQDVCIQTCIFPVRYEDFDNGCVDEIVKRQIFDVDMVMTTSLNGGNNWFDIEGDAIEDRGGFHDKCIGGQDYSQYNYNSNRFISNTSNKHNLTTLPKSIIFGNSSSIIINKLSVRI